MSSGPGPEVGEVSPPEAQEMLRRIPGARLIDVRSRAEWDFVGVPDVSETGQTLICVEWASFPGMIPNPRFVAELEEMVGPEPQGPLLFLCRSGVRSLRAAAVYAEAALAKGKSVTCYNIAEGFEGDLDEGQKRGRLGGWKARGLPWHQR